MRVSRSSKGIRPSSALETSEMSAASAVMRSFWRWRTSRTSSPYTATPSWRLSSVTLVTDRGVRSSWPRSVNMRRRVASVAAIWAAIRLNSWATDSSSRPSGGMRTGSS